MSVLFIALAGCGSPSPTVGVGATAATATTTTTVEQTTTAAEPVPTTTTTVVSTTTLAPATTASVAVLRVTKVVDGDTVDVSSGATVRLIGIDTPESGQCGYREATARLVAFIGGRPVTLEAGARDDVDKYGRLLRYVLVDGVDSGGVLVSEGLAVPRYNSTDGYGDHPREAEYAAEARSSSICDLTPATTVPATPKPTTATTAHTAPTTAAPTAGAYYPSCAAARAAGAAPLYRGDPGYRSGLDRDNDGVACE